MHGSVHRDQKGPWILETGIAGDSEPPNMGTLAHALNHLAISVAPRFFYLT